MQTAPTPGRRVALIAVSVIVFFVFGELVALFIHYVETGGLFYIHRVTYPAIPETRAGQLTGDGLHPYFGPTHKPGIATDIPEALRPKRPGGPDAPTTAATTTNNFGFVSRYDYPFVKARDDQFVVGIFGGSVGVWFCQVGADRLIEQLMRHEFFRNREIVPLCLSHEGYKQPQQLIVLAYFLSIGQRFDLVINIDGFNEVALSRLNHEAGWDISMPSQPHLAGLINLADLSTLTPEKLRSLADISRYRERLRSLADMMARNDLASVNFVLDRVYRRTRSDYQTELGRFNNLPSSTSEASLIQPTPGLKQRDGSSLFEDIATQWAASSVLMNELLSRNGILYFHFLQPNQYYTTRRFTDAEAQVALNGQSPFKDGVERGYPLLVAQSRQDALTTRHVSFFDGTRIFDGETSPVYMDDCCHYTLAGNHILADFIASSILESNGPWRPRNGS